MGAACVLGGSAIAVVRTRGYRVPDEVGSRLVALSGWQYVVVQAAARRICAKDDEQDASIPTSDDTDVAGFVDGYVASMPEPVRRDIGRLLAYVEHLAPLRAGFASRFSRLDADAQDAVLRAMESSSIDLLRGGFEGLKSMCFMGYYRDPRTWRVLAYDGPLVARPPGGFW